MIVLVIATHPDDEVLGCGGVMARHADRGDKVHVVVVSRGIPELFPIEQVEEIRKELKEAHSKLGVTNTIFLDFPAPKLDIVPAYKIADAIKEIIMDLEPETVYLPHRGDLHRDHWCVYNATLVASRPIKKNTVRRLLSYETLSETEWAAPFGDDAFVPTVFVDISNYIDLKIDAMASYRSQLGEPPHSRSLRSLEALATFRGSTAHLNAAESFMLVREIIK